MKRLIFSTLALCLALAGAYAQQHPEIRTRGSVSSGSEEPRSKMLIYNSSELALSGNAEASKYIQFIGDGWKVKKFDSASGVDTSLVMPLADISSWEKVTLPDGGNQSAAAIYRSEFNMRNAWIGRQVFLHIGPVNRSYYVYVNGKRVGYHEDSKAPAEFDITKLVVENEKNHLAIVAYSNPVSTSLENQITVKGTKAVNDIYIFSQPRIRLRDWIVDTRFDPDGNGLLNLGVIVKSHLLNPREVVVFYDLLAPDGTSVLTRNREAKFEMRLEDTVRFATTVAGVQTWSHESPKLYTLVLKLQHEKRFTEYAAIKVGFREVSFDNNGFYINGIPIEIKAVDYTPAADSATIAGDLASMRQKGINMVRVTDYPQSETFYDLTDSYGIYVADQANIDSHLSGGSREKGGNPANDTLWNRAYTERLLNAYHFSRNHPSVIAYSLGKDAGQGYNTYEAYLNIKEKEKSRPVIYEGAGAEWNSDMVVGTPKGRNNSDKRYTLNFGKAANYQAVTQTPMMIITPDPEKDTIVEIANNFKITGANNFDMGYEIIKARVVVASGIFEGSIPAGSSRTFEIPTEGLRPGKYTLNVYVKHKEDSPIAKKEEPVYTISREIRVLKVK